VTVVIKRLVTHNLNHVRKNLFRAGRLYDKKIGCGLACNLTRFEEVYKELGPVQYKILYAWISTVILRISHQWKGSNHRGLDGCTYPG
jgi:hypothetical protein